MEMTKKFITTLSVYEKIQAEGLMLENKILKSLKVCDKFITAIYFKNSTVFVMSMLNKPDEPIFNNDGFLINNDCIINHSGIYYDLVRYLDFLKNSTIFKVKVDLIISKIVGLECEFKHIGDNKFRIMLVGSNTFIEYNLKSKEIIMKKRGNCEEENFNTLISTTKVFLEKLEKFAKGKS